jgi:hypothetical protein
MAFFSKKKKTRTLNKQQFCLRLFWMKYLLLALLQICLVDNQSSQHFSCQTDVCQSNETDHFLRSFARI